MPSPEEKIFSIVVTGEFNPTIFHPQWFANNHLIATPEAESAEDLICTNEIAAFKLDELHFQVEQQRFGLTSKDASKAPVIRDLVLGTFSLLEHTPLTALGLNLDMRFSLDSQEAWHQVGNSLAPKDFWGGLLEAPGMMNVSVRGTRLDCAADRIDFRVQPTGDIENGVFVGVNQHYRLETEDRTSIKKRNRYATSIISDDWTSFQRYAEESAVKLIVGSLERGSSNDG